MSSFKKFLEQGQDSPGRNAETFFCKSSAGTEL